MDSLLLKTVKWPIEIVDLPIKNCDFPLLSGKQTVCELENGDLVR